MQREIEDDVNIEWGSMDLYSGCRRFKEDNIYQEEKQQMLNDGTLDHTYLALSREPRLKKVVIWRIPSKRVCRVSGRAAQRVPLASLKLSMAVYCQKLGGRLSR